MCNREHKPHWCPRLDNRSMLEQNLQLNKTARFESNQKQCVDVKFQVQAKKQLVNQWSTQIWSLCSTTLFVCSLKLIDYSCCQLVSKSSDSFNTLLTMHESWITKLLQLVMEKIHNFACAEFTELVIDKEKGCNATSMTWQSNNQCVSDVFNKIPTLKDAKQTIAEHEVQPNTKASQFLPGAKTVENVSWNVVCDENSQSTSDFFPCRKTQDDNLHKNIICCFSQWLLSMAIFMDKRPMLLFLWGIPAFSCPTLNSTSSLDPPLWQQREQDQMHFC